jgi:hypothetical protein
MIGQTDVKRIGTRVIEISVHAIKKPIDKRFAGISVKCHG